MEIRSKSDLFFVIGGMFFWDSAVHLWRPFRVNGSHFASRMRQRHRLAVKRPRSAEHGACSSAKGHSLGREDSDTDGANIITISPGKDDEDYFSSNEDTDGTDEDYESEVKDENEKDNEKRTAHSILRSMLSAKTCKRTDATGKEAEEESEDNSESGSYEMFAGLEYKSTNRHGHARSSAKSHSMGREDSDTDGTDIITISPGEDDEDYFSSKGDTDRNDEDLSSNDDTDGTDEDFSSNDDADGTDEDFSTNDDTDGTDEDFSPSEDYESEVKDQNEKGKEKRTALSRLRSMLSAKTCKRTEAPGKEAEEESEDNSESESYEMFAGAKYKSTNRHWHARSRHSRDTDISSSSSGTDNEKPKRTAVTSEEEGAKKNKRSGRTTKGKEVMLDDEGASDSIKQEERMRSVHATSSHKQRNRGVFPCLRGGEEDGEQLAYALSKGEETETHAEATEEEPVLKYKFWFPERKPKPGSPDDGLDDLWEDLVFGLRIMELGYYPTEVGDRETGKETGESSSTGNGTPENQCLQGKHDLVLDEEIGWKCRLCSCVTVEIRDVVPPMVKHYSEQLWRTRRCGERALASGGCHVNETSEDSLEPHHSEGTVWDLVPGIRKSLYAHQREGFEFIWKNLAGSILLKELKNSQGAEARGCIISHAPGTGKTRLTIVFLQAYLERFPNSRPVILAPATLLLTWEEEFRKWNVDVPFFNLNNLIFSAKERVTAHRILRQNRRNTIANIVRMVKVLAWAKTKSVLGVSYRLYENLARGSLSEKRSGEKLQREGKELQEILLEKPGLLVLDEGHFPRNQRSHIWKVLSRVKAENRIILSGTPFQNNFLELHNVLCLARPACADDLSVKLKKLSKRRRGEKRGSGNLNVDNDGLEDLKAIMAPFVHVHKGNILQKSLPGLVDCVVVLNATLLQKKLLRELKVCHGAFDADHKLTLVTIHPWLVTRCPLSGKEKKSIDQALGEIEYLELDPSMGVKTRFLFELIHFCQALNEKVLVFSQYIDPLSLICKQLDQQFSWKEGREIFYLHGKINAKERGALINKFNDPDGEAKIVLASTKACAEGINLCGASRVVLLDVVWNPSVERQAISRAYRLGQKKVVYTYHLVIHGTSECDKYCKQAIKDRISELVFASNNEDKAEQSQAIAEDEVLLGLYGSKTLRDMFVRLIPQPKEKDLIETFKPIS